MDGNTRYGIAAPSDVAGRSGREVLQAIVDGELPQAPISRTLGFHLVEVGDGVTVFEGEPTDALLNPMGGVHGGWALTLIDSATGSAGLTTLPAGVGYTTVETKGNLSRPITSDTGRVRVEGRVVSAGRRVISCEAVVTDAEDRVLAHGTSTLLVIDPRGA